MGVATAREVYERVGAPLGLVYTTTARVLDRLQAKGLGSRDKVGKLFAYRALVARREIDNVRMSRALSGFLAQEPRPALASMVDAIEAMDPKLICALHLAQQRLVSPLATLVDGEGALILRVGRLLAPLRPPPAQLWRAQLALAGSLALVAAATIFGLGHGDLLVRALPIVIVG